MKQSYWGTSVRELGRSVITSGDGYDGVRNQSANSHGRMLFSMCNRSNMVMVNHLPNPTLAFFRRQRIVHEWAKLDIGNGFVNSDL